MAGGLWCHLAQVVFDHLVIPAGSFLLQHTERAIQVRGSTGALSWSMFGRV